MIIEYSKNSPATRTPTRANASDAGLDVYADLKEWVKLEPGENHMIPTGLRFGIPHGYMLQVCNRSSMGVKRSLVVGAHIVDSGYDGEVFIDLHNIGRDSQIINPGDKIAQVIMVPVVPFRIKEVHSSSLYSHDISFSQRGSGALGSTDKKHPLGNVPVGGF